ncbi:ABC transporter permease [Streptomyces sp. CA2R106]|uniref:ABC transporter permease n=1 Tax=Streptomyces sp. CA2R106 TaxID=3120153 RepID=UPI00300B17E9
MFEAAGGGHVVGTAVSRPARRLPAVARRSTQHGLVLTAVAVTVLLCATALATLVAMAGRSVASEADRRLAADADAQVSVNAAYRAGGMAAADRAVRAAADRVLAGAPHHTYVGLLDSAAVSVAGVDGSAGPPRGPGASDLHAVAAQDAGGFGRLVSGSWPGGAANAPPAAFTSLPGVRGGAGSPAAVSAAVPQPLAQRLALHTGSRMLLRNASGSTVTVRVSGVFRATRAVGFWPAMAGNLAPGETASQQLLVVAPAALNGSAVLNGHLTAHWSVQPDLPRLGTGSLKSLRDRVAAFAGSQTDISVFHGQRPSLTDLAVSSGLPDAIDALEVPTVAARSALYLPAVMLAVLALATLVLAARQMTVRRRPELALQQARGAGTGRLLRGAAAEWALTGVPAAVAAPYLAGLLHPGSRGAGAWAAVGLTLLVHAAAVLLPVRPRAGRGARAAAAQRWGADLALLAVAVLGFVELRGHRSLVAGGIGAVSVDPVMVLVPAVAGGAAALLLLRLLPLTSMLLDAFGHRGRGLVPALAGWQVSRRVTREAGAVVLMCLAVSVSAFATTALACLGALASEQAAVAVGADVRITAGRSVDYPAAVLGGAYRALPAVTAAVPVSATTANLPGGATEVLDGTVSGPAPRPSGPAAYGVALPGRPAALLLDERLGSDGSTAAPRLHLTVQDADGLADTRTVALPAADGGRHTVAVPLDVPTGDGRPRAYPLTVTALDVLPREGVRPARLDLDLFRIGSRSPGVADTWAAPLPAGQVWSDGTPNAAGAAAGACRGEVTTSTYVYGSPGLCALHAGGSHVFDAVISTAYRAPKPAAGGSDGDGTGLTTGGDSSPDDTVGPDGVVRLLAGPAGGPAPLPLHADARALRDGHLKVGQTTTLDLGDGTPVPARIVGRIDPPQGLGSGQGHLVADQRRLGQALTRAGAPAQEPAFWWLTSTDSARTAAAARARPALGTVTTREGAAAALRSDPFRAGLRQVLELVRFLAPCFAVIAFTVHAVISARRRRREFALLRAVGTSPGRLAALLGTEQVGLALFAVVPGALMGMALASAVLPLVTVDDDGQALDPPLPLVMPWGTVALTAVLTALAVSAVVLALARLLARVDLVRVMRAGEEQ